MLTRQYLPPAGDLTLYWQAGTVYLRRDTDDPVVCVAQLTPTPLSLTVGPDGRQHLTVYDTTVSPPLTSYVSENGIDWTQE
jgi:hypothetical protein